MKKILLLDIENVAVKADELFVFCKKYHRVYVSFAKTPAMFALQDIEELTALLNKKLFLISMPLNKKSNGADFGLAFYAGRLSGEFAPQKTKFHILSGDRDFEHIAKLLQDKEFAVKQIGRDDYRLDRNINDGIIPSLSVFRENIYLHDVKRLCDVWHKYWHKGNRPAKIKTLKGFIYQQVRLTDESIDEIFRLLQQYRIIQVNHTKVVFNQQSVKSWATLAIDEYAPKKSQLKTRERELALPPKPEQILSDLSLKRLKSICELLVLTQIKPNNLPSLTDWLRVNVNIEHELGVQNVIHVMQEYHVMKQMGDCLVFNDEAVENWAKVELYSANHQFVRIDGGLFAQADVNRLKNQIVQLICSEQKAGEVVDEGEYLKIAKSIFPADNDELLMKLAICQQWVALVDGKVVYCDIA